MKPQTSIPILPFKLLCCFFFLIYGSVFDAQVNLVPNPSFEIYKACPSFPNTIDSVPPWRGTNFDSDYYNACGLGGANVPNTTGGYQMARTGSGFAGQYFYNGININYREYIQVLLKGQLQANSCYLVKWFVNSPNLFAKYSCNNIGAYLSQNSFTNVAPPLTANVVSVNPQILAYGNPIIFDTLNWKEIGGVFMANGGEKYLTIGNFRNDASTDTLDKNLGIYAGAYYFIDDVSVEQISSPTWLRDTMINAGDSVFIGSNYGGLACSWYNLTAQLISTKPGFFVKPSTNTNYVVHQSFCGGNFIDTLEVKVNHNLVGLPKYAAQLSKLLLYPQPAAAELSVSGLDGAFKTIRVYDAFGNLLREIYPEPKEKLIILNTTEFSSGIYSLLFEDAQQNRMSRCFIIER